MTKYFPCYKDFTEHPPFLNNSSQRQKEHKQRTLSSSTLRVKGWFDILRTAWVSLLHFPGSTCARVSPPRSLGLCEADLLGTTQKPQLLQYCRHSPLACKSEKNATDSWAGNPYSQCPCRSFSLFHCASSMQQWQQWNNFIASAFGSFCLLSGFFTTTSKMQKSQRVKAFRAGGLAFISSTLTFLELRKW